MSSASKPKSTEVKNNKRKTLKTRSSKHICQERLACRGPQPEAHYKCCECESYQCEACESILHETAKSLFHDRIRLQPPAEDLLCQWDCKNRNFIDVHCDTCNKNLCNHCDAVIHCQGKKRAHTRIPWEQLTNESNQTLPTVLDNAMPSINDSAEFQSISSNHSHSSIPDVASSAAIIDSYLTHSFGSQMKCCTSESFLLVDSDEVLQVTNETEFVEKLNVSDKIQVKVVSIFGNTGEGKSHTLNHTFFDGKEVFSTSPAQHSSTIGVWASFDSVNKIVVIDTEGLLGITSNHNKRTRLLLKVLAVSDVVIYRTRAGRLHNDLFQFLGDASQAYMRHFRQELNVVSERCNLEGPLSSLGPVVIVFHETQYTDILKTVDGKTPEDQLKQRFRNLSCTIDAFSVLEYVGVRTEMFATDFMPLRKAVMHHMGNSVVRSPRKPSIIYFALKVLNEKFNGDIEKTVPNMFPDQYFTCPIHCASCNSRCKNSMNHSKEGLPHVNTSKCKFAHQYDNRVFMCKKCYEQGQEVMVVPKTSAASDSTWLGLAKYAWSGYVLECPRCGIIFRSRQYWYGNKDPVETVVRTEIQHVWPGGSLVLQGTHNAAQKVIDSVTYLSNTVSSVGAKPTKILANWVTDQVAPSYWIPNSQITECKKCEKEFQMTDTKHHCRACGQGFCEDCSSKTRPVPEKGWGPAPVRVCLDCFAAGSGEEETSVIESPAKKETSGDGQEVIARKVTEAIQTTLGNVVAAIDYPLGFIKDSARPAYWIPDHQITYCNVCQLEFSSKMTKHHCRACGQGVCDDCSPNMRPVPSRGWDVPVRICNNCAREV